MASLRQNGRFTVSIAQKQEDWNWYIDLVAWVQAYADTALIIINASSNGYGGCSSFCMNSLLLVFSFCLSWAFLFFDLR